MPASGRLDHLGRLVTVAWGASPLAARPDSIVSAADAGPKFQPELSKDVPDQRSSGIRWGTYQVVNDGRKLTL
jgi:hypothetical protein